MASLLQVSFSQKEWLFYMLVPTLVFRWPKISNFHKINGLKRNRDSSLGTIFFIISAPMLCMVVCMCIVTCTNDKLTSRRVWPHRRMAI